MHSSDGPPRGGESELRGCADSPAHAVALPGLGALIEAIQQPSPGIADRGPIVADAGNSFVKSIP